MERPTLIPYEGNARCPFKFFDNFPEKQVCKIYHDGGHYVATPYFPTHKKPQERTRGERGEIGEAFDNVYAQALRTVKNPRDYKARKKIKDFIRDNLAHLFEDETELQKFVEDECRIKWHRMYMRQKRFERKAFLNEWTYFVTLTYDDKKQDEESFRRKLRKCLSNFHTRRGWKFMGVFERGDETERLHFHALLYVPDGEMVGELTEKQDYSTRKHCMQETVENSFFAEVFGRNDFQAISRADLSRDQSPLDYMLKYIEKTGERITYSRDIPTELCREVFNEDVAAEMCDFVMKYVLFDDVFDHDHADEYEEEEKAIPPKQMDIWEENPEYLC